VRQVFVGHSRKPREPQPGQQDQQNWRALSAKKFDRFKNLTVYHHMLWGNPRDGERTASGRTASTPASKIRKQHPVFPSFTPDLLPALTENQKHGQAKNRRSKMRSGGSILDGHFFATASGERFEQRRVAALGLGGVKGDRADAAVAHQEIAAPGMKR
jgi:hypothetical protein